MPTLIDFCVAALDEEIDRFGAPDLLNSDQRCQFNINVFLDVLHRHHIQISTDVRGCWHDNVFGGWLWRAVKYDYVYLRAYETLAAVRAGLQLLFTFFAARRRHTVLAGRTPITHTRLHGRIRRL